MHFSLRGRKEIFTALIGREVPHAFPFAPASPQWNSFIQEGGFVKDLRSANAVKLQRMVLKKGFSMSAESHGFLMRDFSERAKIKSMAQFKHSDWLL